MRLCTIPGCGGKHKGHGLCRKHLLRLQRHGSTDKPRRRITSLHGTRTRYVAGCRCDECRHASKVYQRIYRLRLAWGPIFTAWLEWNAAHPSPLSPIDDNDSTDGTGTDETREAA